MFDYTAFIIKQWSTLLSSIMFNPFYFIMYKRHSIPRQFHNSFQQTAHVLGHLMSDCYDL